MMAEWIVGISLIAKSNLGAVLAQTSQQSAAAQKSMMGVQSKMSGIAAIGKIVDKTLIGVGLASAATFAMGVKGATDLQNATLQSAIAMGRLGNNLGDTMERMKDFRSIAISMASMTGQSVDQSMDVISRMASSGMKPGQIKQDYRSIAQFTDILHFGKDKTSYTEAATLGAGLTHDLRLFSSEDSKYGLGRIAQLGYLSPHNLSAVTTQIRRMAPSLENVLPGDNRAKTDQIAMLAAWSDRMGNLPFAGSAISQTLTQLIKPRSKRVLGGLEDLGVYDRKGNDRFWDAKSQTFDFMGALQQIQRAVAQGHATGNDTAVKALFSGTQNMSRILSALTSKDALTAYNNVKSQMQGMGADPAAWMDKVQTQLMGTLSGQTALLTSNFRTLSTLLVEQLIPGMTAIIRPINNFLGGDPDKKNDRGALGWLADHPTAAKTGGVALLASAGYAAVRLMQMGGNVMRAFAVISRHPHLGLVTHGMREGAEAGGAAVARRGLFGGAAAAVGGGEGVLGAMFGFREIRKLLSNVPVNRMAEGLRGVPGVERIMSLFGRASGELARLGGVLAKIGGPAKWLDVIFERFGLRLVPFVGEALIAIDALKFLGAHMKDIGFVAGQAAGWIVHHFPSIISGAKDLAVGAMRDLISSIIAVINPANWAAGLQNAIKGFSAGFASQNAPTINVTVHGGSDPHQHGQIVGAVVAHHLSKGGLIRPHATAPGWGGNAVPANGW